MSYIERIYKTIEYIDENLDRSITLEELASRAYCSKYHYHRIFQTVVGDTVMQYIRKRRLMNAAQMLLNTRMKVIDIAVETGFNSHVSFTRLFKQIFGLTPENFRKCGSSDLFRKVDMNIRQKGELGKDYLSGPRVIQEKELKVMGLSVRTGFCDVLKNDPGAKLFQKYWNREKEIKNKVNLGTRYGIITETDNHEYFTYMVGIEVDSIEKVPKGMVYKIIPPSKYAVFTYKGYGEMNFKAYYEAIFYIFGIWLPNSGFELSCIVDMIEVYDERCTNWEDREVDLYIPLL